MSLHSHSLRSLPETAAADKATVAVTVCVCVCCVCVCIHKQGLRWSPQIYLRLIILQWGVTSQLFALSKL